MRRILLAIAVLLAVAAPALGAQDQRARTIYFVVADRFSASQPWDPYVDPAHPEATNTRDCFRRPCPLNEQFRRYWGGDIRGLIDRLPYLDRLGIGGVWVTPLMENVPQYVPSRVLKGWGAAYHGYWVQNYDRVNPHFGTWDDVRALAAELDRRDMRYVQDITLNHSNPNDNHAFGLLQRGEDGATIITSYADDAGRQPAPLYKHFQDTPQCRQAATIPDSQWTYWQLHHCLLADLSGYDQRREEIARYLLDAGTRWLDAGVDDFRLDAVKFPFPSFIARFTETMRTHQAGAGRSEPWFVGEWSGGGVGDPKSLRFANEYDGYGTRILDFSLSLGLNRFVGGAWEVPSEQLDAAGLDELMRRRVAAFRGADTWQGTFIDNHDQIRTLVRLRTLGVTSEGERRRRLDLAHVLLLTARGIPIVMYGDEQYLAHYRDGSQTPPEDVNSGNDDPYNRVGMRRFDERSPGFRIVRALARLRAASPAIQRGAYRTVSAEGDVLVFERRLGRSRVLVAVNRGPASRTEVPAPPGLRPGVHRGVLAGTSAPNSASALLVRADGTTELRLARFGAVVIRVPAPRTPTNRATPGG